MRDNLQSGMGPPKCQPNMTKYPFTPALTALLLLMILLIKIYLGISSLLFQVYNGQQVQGSSLELGYQILFAAALSPPQISSLTFNGISVCSNGNVATTTAATVQPTTTTTPSTATGGSS